MLQQLSKQAALGIGFLWAICPADGAPCREHGNGARRAQNPVTEKSYRTGSDGCCRRNALRKSFSLSEPRSPHLSTRVAVKKIQPGIVWPRAAPGAGPQGRFPTFRVFSSPACPNPHSTHQAQVAAGSLLAAALLPFSHWVAVFFLFYVFYSLSCCQSKPWLKPA